MKGSRKTAPLWPGTASANKGCSAFRQEEERKEMKDMYIKKGGREGGREERRGKAGSKEDRKEVKRERMKEGKPNAALFHK